jgi:SAM-dependent methyltransferase
MLHARYDRIGRTYTSTRRPDPRIAAAIRRALGDAWTVVNVGAGAGAYEPADLAVVALEPSREMARQRPRGAAPVIRASAEAQPFGAAFDATLASLTLHHWSDWRRGVDEMRRVARRIVVFGFDPAEVCRFWLTEAYFPEIVGLDRGRSPSHDDVVRYLGPCSVEHIPVPHDCVDGFLAAYWRRPEAYLDPTVRAGISCFPLLDDVVARGVARLGADLRSGAWDERFGHLRELDTLDVCYRLLTTT